VYLRMYASVYVCEFILFLFSVQQGTAAVCEELLIIFHPIPGN